nr:integrase arm-type DNA-binding domain-containing protein [Pseudomonas sp. AU10]
MRETTGIQGNPVCLSSLVSSFYGTTRKCIWAGSLQGTGRASGADSLTGAHHALSEFTIRHAQPTGKRYMLGGFDGLSLLVTAAGSKCWLFRYYWAGRQVCMSFGMYPAVSLKEALTRGDQARKLLAQDINPREYREQQRFEAEVKHTFQAVYDEWISFRRLSLMKAAKAHCCKIKSITRHDLLAILSTIEQRKAFTMAENCRT